VNRIQPRRAVEVIVTITVKKIPEVIRTTMGDVYAYPCWGAWPGEKGEGEEGIPDRFLQKL